MSSAVTCVVGFVNITVRFHDLLFRSVFPTVEENATNGSLLLAAVSGYYFSSIQEGILLSASTVTAVCCLRSLAGID